MNPPPRPWDRPYRNYLISPTAQNQYMQGIDPLNHLTQVNSSALPTLLSQLPGASKPSIGANAGASTAPAPPAPPPRTSSTSRVRRPDANQLTAYNNNLGYGRYGAMSRYGGYGGYGSYGGYGGYGGGYGGYGSYGGYGGYGGMYGGYGSYGMGQSLQPNPNDPEGQFIRLAEESSRPAFQSIESLVQAFHSVSIMLDSTLTAVHTLFRAVLGMADNFGRLRSLLRQFFGSLALFRIFLWSYRKLLYLVGATKNNPNREEIWQNAAAELGTQVAQELQTNKISPRSSWPILLFLGIVFSGPYLILKFINSLSPSSSARKNEDEKGISWNPITHPGHLRIALYDFTAQSEDELSFQAGQKIIVAPASHQLQGGWLIACTGLSSQIGLVPSNYLAKPRLPGQVRTIPSQAPQPQMPSASADILPVSARIAPIQEQVQQIQSLLQQQSQSLLQQQSQPLPQQLPQSLSQPLLQQLPQSLSQPLPQQLPQSLSQPLLQQLPQSLSQPLLQQLPQSLSQPLPQQLPQSLSQPLPQSLCQPLPQQLPQSLSQQLPQSLSQQLPQEQQQQQSQEQVSQLQQESVPQTSDSSESEPLINKD